MSQAVAELSTRIYANCSRLLAAVQAMEADLPATSQQFSLSLSLYILVQGFVPLIWCAVSEVKGRKVFLTLPWKIVCGLIRVQLVYLVSQAFFAVACIAVALSTNIGLCAQNSSSQALKETYG